MATTGRGESSLQQIADHFHVNKATASKALNGATDVSEGLRRQIIAYASEVGYVSRKASRPNGTIGILWSRGEKENTPIAQAVNAFRTAAGESNYLIEAFAAERETDLTEFAAQHKLCGMLLPDLRSSSPINSQLRTVGTPVVLLDSETDTENPNVSSVKSNDLLAVSRAVNLLVDNGHTLIAFLGGGRDSLAGAERFAGYVMGLARCGIPYRYDLTYFGDFTEGAGLEAADYYIKYSKYFTAIICASDRMAEGFIRGMKRSGVRIPEDLAVVGFEDLKSDAETDLTTIRQDFTQIGKKAFYALKQTMNGGYGQHLTVGCKQIERESAKYRHAATE